MRIRISSLVKVERSPFRRLPPVHYLFLLLIALFPSAANAQFSLMLSSSPDRSNPVALDSSSVTGNIYAFVSPDSGISQVSFFLNDPGMAGSPIQVEKRVAYDFAGTASGNVAKSFDSSGLPNGLHNISALIDLSDGSSEIVSANFTVSNNESTFELRLSTSSDRASPVLLEGESVSGNIFVFLQPESGVNTVSFFLDDPLMNGSPIQTEKKAAYDFAGTSSNGLAKPYDTTVLTDGVHTITALIALSGGGSVVVTSTFDVGTVTGVNYQLELSASPDRSNPVLLGGQRVSGDIYVFLTPDTDILQVDFFVDDAGMSQPPLTVDSTPPFDLADGTVNAANAFDTTTISEGSHTVTAQISLASGDTIVVTSSFVVDNIFEAGCTSISPLACSEVRVAGDYTVSFTGTEGGVMDKNGVGTGFTMIDPPTNPGNPVLDPSAPGYWADKLEVDTNSGQLKIESTPGLQYKGVNSLDNALGVGLNLPSASITIRTTISDLPAGPGGWTQAGLWIGGAGNFGLGTSEDDYIKLIIATPSTGNYIVQALMEQAGNVVSKADISVSANLNSITLVLVANPGDRSIQARYDLGNGEQIAKTFTNVPDEWFSFDQAGIDPSVATRSYAGVFASQRNASSPTVFSFDNFSVTEGVVGGGVSNFEFDEWSVPVFKPTGLAVGPDNRLYVTELFGTIHVFTLDHSGRTIVDEQVIDTIGSAHGGNRLTLGITVDPASTPGNVILWVSHSSGSINNGGENSGVISRLTGSDFATIEDTVTGLPRAIANHAINNIRFGPDGKLYIAAGGNTGAGAPNLANTEFGDRPEQPLSAAILVADVNNPGFQGDCATPIGQFGVPSTCDVAVYASGLRNSYDLAWHHNGSMYATDNGLGVTGTYPPFPSLPCTGLANTSTNNPGTQSDLLLKVTPGNYYGHPNPYRDECVFKNGSYQGVAPEANYEPPLFNLGNNRSANGIIEYNGDTFFSKLMGELLIANFSVGDNITRVKLSTDGTSVIRSDSLISGFSDPLPLAQDKAGHIYVGELNANKVSILVPLPLAPAPTGSWSNRQALPEAILDSGGTALDGKFYMVAGKVTGGHVSSMYIYDPVGNSWSSGPDLPGAAVENSAVVSMSGKLYAFGGSTAPFSGAVSNAARFDPQISTWTSLPQMPTARGGATAQVVNGKIYVAGGMGANGQSVDIVEIYDPVTNSWAAGVAMQTRRDNPGSAVFNDKLYIFGGRTRNADGSTVDGTLSTMEIFDPATNTWTFGSPMLTGRRTMVVGTVSGRAQVMGGESPVVSQNEEYDPETNSWRTLVPMAVPRHGAAAATIRGTVYVAGGGPTAGSSFTNTNDAFAY